MIASGMIMQDSYLQLALFIKMKIMEATIANKKIGCLS